MKNNKDFNDFGELIDESKNDLTSYIEKRIDLARLSAIEKGAKLSSFIVYSLIMGVFALILFILFLVGFGFILGDLLGNYAAGFGVLMVFTLIIFVILILNASKLRRFFTNATLRTMKKMDAE